MRGVMTDVRAGKYTAPADGNTAIAPFKDSIRILEKHTDAIQERADAQLAAAQVAQEEAAARLLRVIVAVGLLAMVIGLLLAWRTSRALTVPLSRTVDVLDAVSRGNLERKVAVERHDEVGRMASALNVAIDHLRRDRAAGPRSAVRPGGAGCAGPDAAVVHSGRLDDLAEVCPRPTEMGPTLPQGHDRTHPPRKAPPRPLG